MKIYVVSQSMYSREVIGVYQNEEDAQNYVRDLEINDRDHSYKGCHYSYQEFELE